MLELHHGEPNTFALMPLIVLHEKGVDFESRYVDPAEFAPTPTNTEAAFNLDGEGPILVHDGKIISEAFFTALYLDEAFPEPHLRPKGAEGHWRVLVWARFVGEVLAPAVSTLGCKTWLTPALAGRDRAALAARVAALPYEERRVAWTAAIDGDYDAAVVEDSRRKVTLAVQKVEDALTGGDWLLGDAYSLADVNVFAMMACLPDLTPDLLNAALAPRTMAWLDRMHARPAVKAAFAEARTPAPLKAFAPGPEHSRWG